MGSRGSYSPDVVGGSALHALRAIFALRLTQPLTARRLRCEGLGHPSLNGAAADFDARRRRVVVFGGGAPHAEVHGVTSLLRFDAFSAAWERLQVVGSVEAEEAPMPRQGVKGTVATDEFLIFGGRLQGGRCMNDVWSLTLEGASPLSLRNSLRFSLNCIGLFEI